MERKILSFDVDMTLLDDNTNKIPESAIESINEIRKDCFIVLGTGRDISQPMNHFIYDKIRPDAMVHANGTKVTIEGKTIFHETFDEGLAQKVMEFADIHKLGLMTLVNGIQYYSREDALKRVIGNKENALNLPQIHLEHISKVPIQEICTMGLVSSHKEACLLQEAFPEIKVTEVFRDFWYDIMESKMSKAVGMDILLKHLKADWSQVIAFGDSMNDYEIMHHAGFSVAMGNASNAVKDIANYITAHVANDGIAKAITYLKNEEVL